MSKRPGFETKKKEKTKFVKWIGKGAIHGGNRLPLPVAVWVTTPKRLGTAGIGAEVGGSRPDGGHRLTDATAARRCHRHFFFSFVVVVVVVPFHHTGLIDSIGPEANVAVASILFAAFLLVDGSIPIEIDSDQVRVDFRSRFFTGWIFFFFGSSSILRSIWQNTSGQVLLFVSDGSFYFQ